MESVTAFQLWPKIVGGDDIEIETVPFQCSLQKRSIGHFCGAAIISVDYVLTAAHCLFGYNNINLKLLGLEFNIFLMNCRQEPPDITVVVGTSKWNSGGTSYRVLRFIRHEKYEEGSYTYDIGLIRVKGPIQFTKYVKPIRYSATEVPDDVELEVFGWGRLGVSI